MTVPRPLARLALGALAASLALAAPARADKVIADDHIVIGDLCIGFDCVNDEAFGADVLRLKENNLRIKLDDTTADPALPDNDWEVIANDSASGGRSYLGVRDVTADRISLRVPAGVPTGALTLGPGAMPRLLHGTLREAVHEFSVENPGAVDGPGLLSALRALPVSTYAIAGDAAAGRRIGPSAADFAAAFGLGEGSQLALGDVAGVALAALKELDPLVTGATAGAQGPKGVTGDPGPAGPRGNTGLPGVRPADFTPSSDELAAFERRMGRLARRQTRAGKRHRALTKGIKRVKRDVGRLR